MVLYLSSAITNMTIYQKNRRRDHKFLPSALLFGFSMARVLTMILRIIWAAKPHAVNVAIAAQIFVNAGVLIVYIINLLFAQRILRAKQPKIGWNPILGWMFRVVYVLIGVAIILVIVLTVITFYTLDQHTRKIARDVTLAALTYITVFAVLPAALLLATLALPASTDAEEFGHGSTEKKQVILGLATCLAMLIAGFRCGTTWDPPRPSTDPAWYDNKAAFYCFEFVPELAILLLYITLRVDKRFHVPNGSSKKRSYGSAEEASAHANDAESVSTVRGDSRESGAELKKEEV